MFELVNRGRLHNKRENFSQTFSWLYLLSCIFKLPGFIFLKTHLQSTVFISFGNFTKSQVVSYVMTQFPLSWHHLYLEQRGALKDGMNITNCTLVLCIAVLNFTPYCFSSHITQSLVFLFSDYKENSIYRVPYLNLNPLIRHCGNTCNCIILKQIRLLTFIPFETTRTPFMMLKTPPSALYLHLLELTKDRRFFFISGTSEE